MSDLDYINKMISDPNYAKKMADYDKARKELEERMDLNWKKKYSKERKPEYKLERPETKKKKREQKAERVSKAEDKAWQKEYMKDELEAKEKERKEKTRTARIERRAAKRQNPALKELKDELKEVIPELKQAEIKEIIETKPAEEIKQMIEEIKQEEPKAQPKSEQPKSEQPKSEQLKDKRKEKLDRLEKLKNRRKEINLKLDKFKTPRLSSLLQQKKQAKIQKQEELEKKLQEAGKRSPILDSPLISNPDENIKSKSLDKEAITTLNDLFKSVQLPTDENVLSTNKEELTAEQTRGFPLTDIPPPITKPKTKPRALISSVTLRALSSVKQESEISKPSKKSKKGQSERLKMINKRAKEIKQQLPNISRKKAVCMASVELFPCVSDEKIEFERKRKIPILRKLKNYSEDNTVPDGKIIKENQQLQVPLNMIDTNPKPAKIEKKPIMSKENKDPILNPAILEKPYETSYEDEDKQFEVVDEPEIEVVDEIYYNTSMEISKKLNKQERKHLNDALIKTLQLAEFLGYDISKPENRNWLILNDANLRQKIISAYTKTDPEIVRIIKKLYNY